MYKINRGVIGGGGSNSSPPPLRRSPKGRGYPCWGALLILHQFLHFPSSGNLHSTLHCIALHSPSDQIVYMNIVKKGINIFLIKGFLRGGGTMLPRGVTNIFCALPHKCSRTPLKIKKLNLACYKVLGRASSFFIGNPILIQYIVYSAQCTVYTFRFIGYTSFLHSEY